MKKTTEWIVTETFQTEEIQDRKKALQQILNTYQRIQSANTERNCGQKGVSDRCNAPSIAD